MSTTTDQMCDLLTRSQLMTAEQVRTLRRAWDAEPGDKADADRFAGWLVERRYATPYQVDRLRRGQATHYVLGQYKLLDRIGEGRMAGVYEAVHTLGQKVAIKILPPSKARDETALARFHREARLACKLDHPHIVRTFEAGVFDGLHFLVMEHLDGETLADTLKRRKKLPPAEAARLLRQALLGLDHMHEQGMIHRDLKPDNLMLVPCPRPAGPDTTAAATVKLLDIGLGKEAFDESGGDELTAAGELLGTPAYMSPEQARNAQSADIRSDLYSLGCVLYHVLTGRPPFLEKNAVKLLTAHATLLPPPVAALAPDIPDGLAHIVAKLLDKDPAMRYPTPRQAAEALAAFAAAEPGAVSRRYEEARAMAEYLAWLRDPAEQQPDPVPVEEPAAETERAGSLPAWTTLLWAGLALALLLVVVFAAWFKPG